MEQLKRSWRTWIIHGARFRRRTLRTWIDWLTNSLICKYLFWSSFVYLFTEWPTDWQRKWTIVRLTYWLFDRQTDSQSDRPTDRPAIRYSFLPLWKTNAWSPVDLHESDLFLWMGNIWPVGTNIYAQHQWPYWNRKRHNYKTPLTLTWYFSKKYHQNKSWKKWQHKSCTVRIRNLKNYVRHSNVYFELVIFQTPHFKSTYKKYSYKVHEFVAPVSEGFSFSCSLISFYFNQR